MLSWFRLIHQSITTFLVILYFWLSIDSILFYWSNICAPDRAEVVTGSIMCDLRVQQKWQSGGMLWDPTIVYLVSGFKGKHLIYMVYPVHMVDVILNIDAMLWYVTPGFMTTQPGSLQSPWALDHIYKDTRDWYNMLIKNHFKAPKTSQSSTK